MSQSIAIVTSYATLGAEGLITSLVQTGARAIFIDCDLIHVLTKALVTATEVKVIIYNDSNMKEGEIDKLKAAHSHITILSFEELRFIGEKNPEEPLPPNADDLCCIMYTSGSTGTPKGKQSFVSITVESFHLLTALRRGTNASEHYRRRLVILCNFGNPAYIILTRSSCWT